MNRKFETVFNECLDSIQAGESVEACLARYPEHAEALRPLLSLATAVRAVPLPRPNPLAVHASRQRMLRAVSERDARQPLLAGLFAWPWLRATLALAVLILVVGFGSRGLVAVSAGSLPGDNLYPVKRFAENVRYALTLDPVARQQLEAEFAAEREKEVRTVLDSGRLATVEFRGNLEALGDGLWGVSGLEVILTDQTVIVGQPAVGAMVLVQARSAGDGTLLALRLEVQSLPLPATLTAAPTPRPSLTPTATRSTVTSTPTQPPTRTPAPTATPSPTRTATEEPTAVVSATPEAVETQEPESTDEPESTETEEPEPTREPEPTGTEEPEPTDEPGPTETEEPEPTDEPGPTETEEPEPTDEPAPTGTEEPEPTDEPAPTKTEQPDFLEPNPRYGH
ncbi:MAG: DUF5667 domain-containing protein [Anaerolineae bacterium]